MENSGLTFAQRKENARQFANRWRNKGQEDQHDQSYWNEILHEILGIERPSEVIDYQKRVVVNGHRKRIDGYIPETKVIIEQKSLNKALDQKITNSGDVDLTPYEQAKRYNDNLPYDEKARWIVTSNFREIWIYDMNKTIPEDNIVKIELEELPLKYSLLKFLVKEQVKVLSEEMKLSIKAGELVAKIHDRFEEQYSDPLAPYTQHSLNVLCVRLVFCYYAEDAGLFGEKDAFKHYLEQYQAKNIRNALQRLFQTLDTKIEERDEYLEDDLAAFPYVNGGLFREEHIVIPKITDEIRTVLLESSEFDWSQISPTIFGAVFESTLNPETRRSGGMHYTSIENIHKVIDPLFLDDLNQEFDEIKKIAVDRTRTKHLRDFQDKLANLVFFDPACGSGNFLTETFVSLRRLENKVISELQNGQISFGDVTETNGIKIDISNFYGIEINDFAATVAKTALWIAESQMMQETETIIKRHIDFLPLKTNASIVEGNALRLDWEKVVPKERLNYIMGNPPFVGKSYQSKSQKEEMAEIFKGVNGFGNLDYVASWYKKAVDFTKGTLIRTAFVSTNSICQGIAVPPLWEYMISKNIFINFAYRTFIWSSEASSKAAVHCVIIGFSYIKTKAKMFSENNNCILVDNINPYLCSAPNIIIKGLPKSLCHNKQMIVGSCPTDGGGFILSPEEKEDLIKKEPIISDYIHPYIGSEEYINKKIRYCLWLRDAPPSLLKNAPLTRERIKQVQNFRLASKKEQTRKRATTPTLFAEDRYVESTSIFIPMVSSENRRYIPMGLCSPEVVITNKALFIPDADLYTFGIIISNVHMSWMRTVAGRLKSDYSYSATIVYNTFPWPTPTEEQKAKIEQTAQGILDARTKYPDSSLADLYDPLTMPKELLKAHQANDRAVMQAYGFSTKMSEADCVAELMKMYQKLTEEEKAKTPTKKKK